VGVIIRAPAVAENQPEFEKQNRMTSELSNFAARLREFINSEGRVSRGPDLGIRIEDADSYDSSLRTEAGFNSLALELFALHFAHNAAYRRFCESRCISPQSVTRWSEIPAVPTAAFKELEFTCLPVNERSVVFHSSGTTEQRPSRHFHNAESLAVYEASSVTWFQHHISCHGGLLILTPPPAQSPHSSLVHMFETVRRDFNGPTPAFAGRANADGQWALDFDMCVAVLRGTCKSKQPLVMLGTAFSLVHLLDVLAGNQMRFELPTGSRVMETGGYKGRSRSLPKAELHALITERLGIPTSCIVCEYGMSELSSQAYDSVGRRKLTPDPLQDGNCTAMPRDPLPSLGGVRGGSAESAFCHSSPDTRHFHFAPWTRVQIISPETGREVAEGETSLVRVFDLANVFSVMAIQAEDLAVRRGHGFELIGRAALAGPRGCSLMAV